MADVAGTGQQLEEAWRRLHLKWLDTTAVWHDRVRARFQREYLEPLEQQVRVTQREMAQLAEAIEQARRHVK